MALKQVQQAAGSSGGTSTLPRQQAETLLVLHQLTWLFSGMRAVLQLLGLLDAAAASNMKQEAAELAIEVLRAASPGVGAASSSGQGIGQARGNGSSSNGGPAGCSTAAAVQLACTTAVLQLLSVPGQLSLPGGQARELLGVLQGLAEQHGSLHGVLAGVLGGLGSEATSGSREYEVRRLYSLRVPSVHIERAGSKGFRQDIECAVGDVCSAQVPCAAANPSSSPMLAVGNEADAAPPLLAT